MKTAAPARPRVVRKRVNGRDVRLRRPDAAANARTKKVMILGHGASSRALMHGALDQRTRVGRAYRAHEAALVAHLGGAEAVTVPQRSLIDQAARLHLLGKIAWAELQRTGAFRAGELVPAFDAFRRAAADERAVLALLGLERKTQQLPSIEDYLDGHTAEQPGGEP